MTTLKKTLVLALMAIGFIIILGDSDKGFLDVLIIKVIGLALFFLGIQLCATWKLFGNFLNKQ